MRRLSFVGLVVVLVVAAGCGGPTELTVWEAPRVRDLKGDANRFHENPESNRPTGKSVQIECMDIDGKPVDLASFRGKSNVVLVVVKGLPKSHPPGDLFCPGCLAQIHSLTANYGEFQKRHAEILMVFPGPADKLPDFLATAQVDGANGNPKVPFPLLKDTDLRAVNSLGIDGDWARPSTYILDKSGNAVFAYVGSENNNTNSFDRPSVKALLAQLDKLNANK